VPGSPKLIFGPDVAQAPATNAVVATVARRVTTAAAFPSRRESGWTSFFAQAANEPVPIENTAHIATIEVTEVLRIALTRGVRDRLAPSLSLIRSRASLHLQIVALRHQLAVVTRSRRPRLRFTTGDRVLWAGVSQRWHGWRAALHVVQPATVLV
jgi:hypothetical protein